MADSLLGVIRHQALELGLSVFMLEMRRPGPGENAGEFRPDVGGAHIDDPYGLDAWPRRLDAEEGRGFATLNTAPEFPLRGHDEMLIKRIGMGFDFDPLATTGNHREDRRSCRNDPHVMLQLGHIFSHRRFLRERPRQHELAFEDIATLDPTVEGRGHPGKGRMAGPLLDICDDPPRVGLVPPPIQLLGSEAELHDQIAGQVVWLNLAPLFPPQTKQRALIVTQDDSGIRAADERAAIRIHSGGIPRCG